MKITINKSKVFATMEVLLHVVVLMAPIFLSGILHDSDDVMAVVPSVSAAAASTADATDEMTNITEIRFGLRHFSLHHGFDDSSDSSSSSEDYGGYVLAYGLGNSSSSSVQNGTAAPEEFDNAYYVHFSEEQEDALGSNYEAAHVTYHILDAFMILCFLVPLFLGLKHRYWNKMDWKSSVSALLRIVPGCVPALICSAIAIAASIEPAPNK